MIVGIADNIFSPLGHSSQENFEAVRQGKSRLCEYTQGHRLPEPFVASLFEGDDRKTMPGLTLFETIVVKSVERALAQTNVDTTSPRTLFVISSTKGNIDLLDEVPEGISRDRVLLGKAADVIARHFHSPNRPVVVSNACISGLSAQIAAIRMLRSGYYDTAIVVGAEVQSRFIVSGFQSFKALSPMACKPFDAERLGLKRRLRSSIRRSMRPDLMPGYLWPVLSEMMLSTSRVLRGLPRGVSGHCMMWCRDRTSTRLHSSMRTARLHYIMMKWRLLLLTGPLWLRFPSIPSRDITGIPWALQAFWRPSSP